eukprot:3427209-Rhodomonas_salina.1
MHGRGRGGEGEGERVRARRRGQGALREGRTGRRGIAAMQNAFKFNAKFSKCKVPLWGGKYPDFSNSRPESSVTSVLCPRRSELAGQDPQWCEVLSMRARGGEVSSRGLSTLDPRPLVLDPSSLTLA